MAIVAIAQGFFQIAFQLLASKLVTAVFGSSLLSWTLLIAIFLTSMAGGQRLGARLSIRGDSPRQMIAVAFGLAGLWPLVLIVAGSWFQDISTQGISNPILGCAILISGVFGLPVFLTSIAMPLALKNQTTEGDLAGSSLGRLSSLNSLASVSGALFVAFISFGPVELGLHASLGVLAALLLGTAVWMQAQHFRLRREMRALLIVAILVATAATTAGARKWGRTIVAKDAFPVIADRVLAERESFFSHLRVIERPTPQGSLRQLIFPAIKGSHCGIRIQETTTGSMQIRTWMPTSGYVRLAWGAEMAPRSALILGLGGGCISHQFRAWLPPDQIPKTTYVEIDPAVVDVTRSFFFLPAEDAVVIDDARSFLAKSDQHFDLIFVDVFADSRQLPDHLFTLEFFEQLKNELAPGGTVFMNLVTLASLPEVEDGQALFFNRLGATVHTAFPESQLAAYSLAKLYSFEASRSLPQNILISISKHPLSTKLAERRLKPSSAEEKNLHELVAAQIRWPHPKHLSSSEIYSDVGRSTAWDLTRDYLRAASKKQ